MTTPSDHTDRRPPMTDQPASISPEALSAILRDPDDPRYPSQITVFCDHCGHEDTRDYLVSEDMTRQERLAVARQYLVANEGWECDPDGDDFCPVHASTDGLEQRPTA
ncbi:hypothetical protein [Streptomyces sp. NPDC019937]|uniref:hypothetical protein n=1 Tax=Streptomyces sp. NPDC019937 TaxID=3154787 RepID=UPI0033D15BCA